MYVYIPSERGLKLVSPAQGLSHTYTHLAGPAAWLGPAGVSSVSTQEPGTQTLCG